MNDAVISILGDGWLAATVLGFGVIVTALSQIVSTYRRSKADHQIELAKLSIQLAKDDYRDELKRKQDDFSTVRPLSAYIYFHYRFLRLVDQNKMAPKDVKNFLAEYSKVIEIYSSSRGHQFNGDKSESSKAQA